MQSSLSTSSESIEVSMPSASSRIQDAVKSVDTEFDRKCVNVFSPFMDKLRALPPGAAETQAFRQMLKEAIDEEMNFKKSLLWMIQFDLNNREYCSKNNIQVAPCAGSEDYVMQSVSELENTMRARLAARCEALENQHAAAQQVSQQLRAYINEREEKAKLKRQLEKAEERSKQAADVRRRRVSFKIALQNVENYANQLLQPEDVKPPPLKSMHSGFIDLTH